MHGPAAADHTLGANNIKIASYDGISSQYMGMSLRLPIFRDVRVRQAITCAIDRQGNYTRVCHYNNTPGHLDIFRPFVYTTIMIVLMGGVR